METIEKKRGFVVHPEEWKMVRDVMSEEDIVAALFPVLDACLMSADPSEAIGEIIKTNLAARIFWDRNVRDIDSFARKLELSSERKKRFRSKERAENAAKKESPVVETVESANTTEPITVTIAPEADRKPVEDPAKRPDYVPSDREALELGRLSSIPDEYTERFMQLMADKGWGYITSGGKFVQLNRRIFRSVLKAFYDRDQKTVKESAQNGTALHTGSYKLRLGQKNNEKETS